MTNKYTCETCKIRLPKNRPLLICTLCQKFQHYKCNNLSRKDAESIMTNPTETCLWVCQSCYTENFPGFDSEDIMTVNDRHDKPHTDFCTVCDKQCSVKSQNRASCFWCDSLTQSAIRTATRVP